MSQRSETGSVFANPDGTWTREDFGVPVQFVDSTGVWRSVDPTLVPAADGGVGTADTVGPVWFAGQRAAGSTPTVLAQSTAPGPEASQLAAAGRLVGSAGQASGLAGRGSHPAVAAGAAGSVEPSVALQWAGAVPAPQTAGPTSSYPDLLPGIDLQLRASRTGFEDSWVIKDLASGLAQPSLTIPLRLTNATVKAQGDGSYAVLDRDGVRTGTISAPVVFDARRDAQGDPLVRHQLPMTVTPTKAGVTLTVTGYADVLQDPATVFPVTIDPTTTSLTPTFDTTVQEGTTTDSSTGGTLHVGNFFAGTQHESRSYLNWQTSDYVDKQIVSSTLNMYLAGGGTTCDPKGWSLSNSGPASTATRWTAQPPIYTQYATASVSKGLSGCPAGNVSIDATGWMRLVVASNSVGGAMVLRATDETDATAAKVFASSENSSPPMLSTTYTVPANPAPAAGARRGATRLPFSVSGAAGVAVDVGSGNASYSQQLLSLPGTTGDVPVGLTYNSSTFGTSVPSAVTGTNGSGWSISGFDERLVTNSDGTVTYYGPGGLTGVFRTGATAGSYLSPAQFQATLVSTGTGWSLTSHGSGEVAKFGTDGRLSTVTTRNGQVMTFTLSAGLPASIVSSRGSTAARTATFTAANGRITAITETSGSLTRKVTLGYTSGGNLGSVTDLTGGVTSFTSAYGTDTGQVVTVTNPAGSTTTLAYTGSQATSVAQSNTATGSPGTSTTRISYPSATQTVVADPTTDQAKAVTAVPRTTYAINSSQLVASATDPDGNARSASYTSLGQVATSTSGTGGTATSTYGANTGESLTSAATPGGARSTATYGGTGASQYKPSQTTDDAGNTLKSTYDGSGNQLTAAANTDPGATLTYNTDGTVNTAAKPGATGGAVTAYHYDAAHQLTGVTAPTGTSLGDRTVTYDGFSRLATVTDGRGDTLTPTYDSAGRTTKLDYSDTSTHDVTYVYDKLGRVTSRTDGAGTTTYTLDALGRTLSTVNTAGGGTITYRYDLAGALISEADGRGTTTYLYDAAHQLTSMTYPKGTGTQTVAFANDANGRRTDTWLQSNTDHSSWAAHTHQTYDASGRVTHVLSQAGPAATATTVLDQSVCYASGSVAPACSTAASVDRSKIRWVTDAKTGETTTFTYDGHGRLTKAAITGGTNPRSYDYTYDAAGNRVTSAVTGTAPASQTLGFNAADQIATAGYTYDGAGNLTRLATGVGFGYNTAGQRITATTTGGTPQTSYIYAGTSQAELLTQATAGGNTYHYVYGRTDSNGQPVIETASLTNNAGTTVQAYVAHDPTGQPVLLQTSTGTVAMYVYDARNNPVGLITDSGSIAYQYAFDPYGTANLTQNSGGNGVPQNPYVYAGGLQDRDTGLIRYGARWYNPTTGTWTQRDTLDAPLNAANSDRYIYAADDPINASDPTGLYDWNALGIDIIATATGATFGVGCSVVSEGFGIVGCAVVGAAIGVGVSETLTNEKDY